MSFSRYEVGPYKFYAIKGAVTRIFPDGNLMRSGLRALNLKFNQEKIREGFPKYTVYYIGPYDVSNVLRLMPELTDFFKHQILEKKRDSLVWKKPRLDKRLFPYQREGVHWLLQNKSGYLADEMGLGKTIQALQYLENTPFTKALVVAPASVSFNWENEAREWAPSWHPYCLGSATNIRKTAKSPPEGRICYIVTWAQLANCGEQLINLQPEVLIGDEAHRAKSVVAKRTMYAVILSKYCSSVVLLSGTPMRNCAIDLFSQMNMVAPDAFPSFDEFSRRYSPPTEKTGAHGTYWVYDTSTNMDELRKKCKPYMMFRKKAEVLQDLPPLRHRKLQLPIPTTVRTEWEYLVEAMKDGELYTPDLIKHRQAVGGAKAKSSIEWILENSSKNDPLVVFFVHKGVHNLLKNHLSKEGISFESIVGSTPSNRRGRIIENFQKGDYQVLLCSEAAKEGVTLTRASQLLQLERYWVPADEEQAEARVHRIGSTKPVIITYAHADGTIDDLIVSKLSRKREAIQKLFERDLMDENLLSLILRQVSL